MKNYTFTSESVTEGHPDKVADLISDAIADHIIDHNQSHRAAIETLVTTNMVMVAGEYKSSQNINDETVENIVRNTVREIGYDQEGFSWKKLTVHSKLREQSADIALGTDTFGAGDQGMMFGYACNETDSLMPSPIDYSHRITKALSDARHNGTSWLGPDGKSQITFLYSDINTPVGISNIVCSTQHDPSLTTEEVETGVREIINPIVSDYTNADTTFFINPTGRFVIGGPDGDTGLTGRKIIVDTYGGAAPHGGGAFSGKDPSKVDRSAAYAARYLAKNIVASGLANECTIQLAYAIGIAKPISVNVDCNGKSKINEDIISQKLQSLIDLSPRGICEHLDLKKPIYSRTSSYGHFGRKPEADGGFSWEKVDLMDKLKTTF